MDAPANVCSDREVSGLWWISTAAAVIAAGVDTLDQLDGHAAPSSIMPAAITHGQEPESAAHRGRSGPVGHRRLG